MNSHCPTKKPPLAVLLALLLPTLALAEQKEFIKFTTEKVVVFKDGYALVIKKGKGKADANGEIHTLEVPDAAVLGSFWATTPKEGSLIGMRAGWRKETSKEDITESALNNLAILRANEGADCVAVTTAGETLRGVILKVLVKEGQVSTSVANTSRSSHLSSTWQPAPSGAGSVVPVSSVTTSVSGTHFVLRTIDGDVLLPTNGLRSLKIPKMKTQTTRSVTEKTRSKQLSFRFAKPGGEHQITMIYFRPGIRWIPTYRINLPHEDAGGDNKIAEVAMQAEIINEAEDLIEVPIDIVIGVPNFRFKKTPSPLALESVMRNALVQAEPDLMGQSSNAFSNASYASRHGERFENGANTSEDGLGELDASGALSGSGAQDLFVYNLPNLRLLKGDRAAVAIFTAKVPYRDVYTWDLKLQRDDIATAPSGAGIDSPMKLTSNRVWHQIELTNATKVPWTTGAAIIMQGHQPLAQELLTYTSTGDLCRVPVTISVETRGSFTEAEVERKLNVLKWDSRSYAKITNRASLHLCNNKRAPIDVEISVTLGGRVSTASDKGTVALKPFNKDDWNNYRGSPAVNNRSVVNWQIKLQPDAIFEPTIDYNFHTRQ